MASKLATIVVDGAFVCEDVDEVKAVPLAGGKIIGVMRGCDLDRSSPEAHVDQLCVRDDGNLSAVQGVNDVTPMQVLVPASTIRKCQSLLS